MSSPVRTTLWLILLTSWIAPFAFGSSYDVLTLEDFQFQKIDRLSGPALSSPRDQKPTWQSFNQWLCFNPLDLEIRSLEIGDEFESSKIPAILVYNHCGAGGFQFEAADLHLDYTRVLEVWNYLAADASKVCFLSAHLQSFEDGESVWIINRLKSNRGYWIGSSVDEDASGSEFMDIHELSAEALIK